MAAGPYNRPMMENWDTTSHSQTVQSLLQLRHQNQALALGSHHTAWIVTTFSLHVTSGPAVMVMVNKGDDDHVVDAENIKCPMAPTLV